MSVEGKKDNSWINNWVFIFIIRFPATIIYIPFIYKIVIDDKPLNIVMLVLSVPFFFLLNIWLQVMLARIALTLGIGVKEIKQDSSWYIFGIILFWVVVLFWVFKSV